MLPDVALTLNLLLLIAKLPVTLTAPLALIAAAVVVPVIPNVPPTVVLVLTSKLPGSCTLVFHTTLPILSDCSI